MAENKESVLCLAAQGSTPTPGRKIHNTSCSVSAAYKSSAVVRNSSFMVKFLVEMGQPTFSVVLPSKQDEQMNGVLLAKLRNVRKQCQLQVLH